MIDFYIVYYAIGYSVCFTLSISKNYLGKVQNSQGYYKKLKLKPKPKSNEKVRNSALKK